MARMPRKRGKDKEGEKYSQGDLEKALESLKNGSSLRSVSKKYNIPRTTLLYKKNGTRSLKSKKGPECVLGAETEHELVRWVFYMSDHGFPVTRHQLVNSVQTILKKTGQKTPFIDNKPGRSWLKSFEARHPELCERFSQNLLYTRVSLSEEKIRSWFGEVKKTLESENLLEIDGSRIYNCAESGFMMSPKGEKVLVRKGDKTAYNFVNNDDKECLTVLFGGNAAGQLLPPMILFNYKRIPRSVALLMPQGWGCGHTETGWVTAQSFYEWLKNIFYPWLQTNKIEFPVILYVDGHVSHMTLQLSDYCREKQIVLIALYPNATHILQPMDVAVFRPLKMAWSTVVRDWRVENNAARLQRNLFGGLLKKALDNLDLESILRSGFRATGLHPFSADAVNNAKVFKTTGSSLPHGDLREQSSGTESAEEMSIEKRILTQVLAMFEAVDSGSPWNGPGELADVFHSWRSLTYPPSNREVTSNSHPQSDINSETQVADDEPTVETQGNALEENIEDLQLDAERNSILVSDLSATNDGTPINEEQITFITDEN